MRSYFPGVDGTLMSVLFTHKLDTQTHARANVGLEALCTVAFSIIKKRIETSCMNAHQPAVALCAARTTN